MIISHSPESHVSEEHGHADDDGDGDGGRGHVRLHADQIVRQTVAPAPAHGGAAGRLRVLAPRAEPAADQAAWNG